MPLKVHQFPCLSDNYGFLALDEASGQAACIDTPEAGDILRELDKLGWKLTLILNTHWHPDHAGGNAEIKAATGATIVGPNEVTRLTPIDREVKGGDRVRLGETEFEVIESGGHTLGHIAYHDAADRIAFVGDTLFALGCGRLFEGTPEQMHGSLQRIAGLPDETLLYPAHEYTLANARFAAHVAPGDAAVRERHDRVVQQRLRGDITLPTTVAQEKATNPFVRAGSVEEFARLRSRKDNFG